MAAYLSGKGDASEAYAQVYTSKSPAAIRANASRLLTNDNVKAALVAARAARAERTMVTADWVVERLQVEALFMGEGSSHAARVSALKVLALQTGALDGKGTPPPAQPITIHTILVPPAKARQEIEADGSANAIQG